MFSGVVKDILIRYTVGFLEVCYDICERRRINAAPKRKEIGTTESKSVDLPPFLLYKFMRGRELRLCLARATLGRKTMQTEHSRLTSRLLLVLLIISVLGALWPSLTMRKIDARLMENPPHNGIVSFELAWNASEAVKMIDAWGPELSLLAGKSIRLDFLFIPAYVLLFFSVTMLLARLTSGPLRRIIRFAAYLPIVSGIADVTENIFLLLVLKSSRNIPAPYPLVASSCASVKFALLAVVVCFWVIAIAAFIFRKIGKKPAVS